MITEKELIRIHFMCYLLLLVCRLSVEIRHIGRGILLAERMGHPEPRTLRASAKYLCVVRFQFMMEG